MREDEISNGVGPLDRELIVVEGVEEPWVLGLYEDSRVLVCPELFDITH